MSETVRIDKWLWAARFFKTRGLAREAVAGGKVRLAGKRVKPGRTLKPGDQLSVSRGEELFELTVSALSDRRLSAPLAQELFAETDASKRQREAAAEQRKLDRAAHAQRIRRPDKRDRRKIIDFTRKQD
jgi:ribosome-associated heat shock protein Hsp15